MKRLLALTFTIGVANSSFGQDRPNILFFLSDDQRHDQLGVAGHPRSASRGGQTHKG